MKIFNYLVVQKSKKFYTLENFMYVYGIGLIRTSHDNHKRSVKFPTILLNKQLLMFQLIIGLWFFIISINFVNSIIVKGKA